MPCQPDVFCNAVKDWLDEGRAAAEAKNKDAQFIAYLDDVMVVAIASALAMQQVGAGMGLEFNEGESIPYLPDGTATPQTLQGDKQQTPSVIKFKSCRPPVILEPRSQTGHFIAESGKHALSRVDSRETLFR
jgi:hypothetical protein